MANTSIDRASFTVKERDLELMVLHEEELPPGLAGDLVLREGMLDNETMAQHGFPGSTEGRLRTAGRMSGYIREFLPSPDMVVGDGSILVAATVVHLFDNLEQVNAWMHDIFIKEFEDHVGQELGHGDELISVRRLEPTGFYDEAVGLQVLQGSATGLQSSTVIDFRVGRILGVTYVGAVGDHQYLDLTTQLGLALEKRIVSVVLGS